MESIKAFLRRKGLSPNHIDAKIEMGQVVDLISEYATAVREEQITYSAIGAAHHTAINVRCVHERIDEDLLSHQQGTCRVQIVK